MIELNRVSVRGRISEKLKWIFSSFLLIPEDHTHFDAITYKTIKY